MTTRQHGEIFELLQLLSIIWTEQKYVCVSRPRLDHTVHSLPFRPAARQGGRGGFFQALSILQL